MNRIMQLSLSPKRIAAILVIIFNQNSYAQDSAQDQSNIIDYQVIAKKLDESRNDLSPQTGSSTYHFDQSAINNLPQGSSTPINQVLLRAPSVAQGSYGQLFVRGDHANLQYRINGIILPEGISGFGQTLDTRFAEKIDLVTGALPAQYGYRTAGVVNITTKNGGQGNGGRSSVMAGGNNYFQGNQEIYGSKDRFNYYVNGTYLESDRGLEPATAARNPAHDHTQQDKEFGYFSYMLNEQNRLSLMLGNATNRFEIPNNPGRNPDFPINGVASPASANLNQRQFERNSYAILALDGKINPAIDYQLAVFSRRSKVLYKPDQTGDLVYNGISSRVDNQNFASGIQNDYTYRLFDDHTLRGGLFFNREQAKSGNNSSTFLTDANGDQLDDIVTIADSHSKTALMSSIYLQDEWEVSKKLTINYGARFDDYKAYVHENQLSPRLGAVYEIDSSTKLHAGYARYFTPPPTELIAPVSIAKFNNTTAALPSSKSSSVKSERSNYFDLGVVHKINENLSVGIDSYYKQSRNLLDEGQFGQALIYAPFNYEKGYAKGVELSVDYKDNAFSAYANLALAEAKGKGVASGQYNFSQEELDYIASHSVYLDHAQTLTGAAGVAYKYYGVTTSGDVIYGSGLRKGDNNTERMPSYTTFNLGVARTFDLGIASALDAKLSIVNLLNRRYQIHDGSGIGIFAPQYGLGRTIYLSLSKPYSF